MVGRLKVDRKQNSELFLTIIENHMYDIMVMDYNIYVYTNYMMEAFSS